MNKKTAELVVLVNEQNEPIGTLEKSQVHNSQTPLHRGFSVFVFGPKGQVLLQQRAKHKITWGGVWSNSCCGHPLPEEKTLDEARRRLNYELVLNEVELHEILPNYRYRFKNNGIWENEFCPVFVGFTDQMPIMNKGEVEKTLWVPWFKFLTECKTHPENYSPWAVEEALLLSQNELFVELYKQFYDEKNKRF